MAQLDHYAIYLRKSRADMEAENGDSEAQWEIANYYWDKNNNENMKETVKQKILKMIKI